MERLKKHKVKREKLEASTSFNKKQVEHDLTHYIHDRVELMHLVFSVLKSKEIKMLAPECVRHISLDNLQELCTEELLGISSKRLHAILDGADPPSDTESSSPSPSPQLETISLDSISSDEEILSQHSGKKKKHKHRRRGSKKRSQQEQEDEVDKSKASRAGLTVLELLELQARARAIRAQLQQEQALKSVPESGLPSDHDSSENEVEIKEEPAEVVEISSDEEKPKVEELERVIQQPAKPMEQTSAKPVESEAKSLTRKANELVITVPQTKKTRKIKLNRGNKITVSVSKGIEEDISGADGGSTKQVPVSVESPKRVEGVATPGTEVQKKTKRKKKKRRTSKVEEVDNDEITLQLSDSEKMDLLENLERRKASSSDGSGSSSDADTRNSVNAGSRSIDRSSDVSKSMGREKRAHLKDADVVQANGGDVEGGKKITTESRVVERATDIEITKETNENCSSVQLEEDYFNGKNKQTENVVAEKNKQENEVIEGVGGDDVTEEIEKGKNSNTGNIIREISTVNDIPSADTSNDNSDTVDETRRDLLDKQETGRELSEGEVTDRDSSEVEAVDLQSEVVCLSDDETEKRNKHREGRKSKKAKKSKRGEKKSRKSDFHEGADQNFYRNDINENGGDGVETSQVTEEGATIVDDEEIQEILELSDDSSCYEVDGAVLSKEPTAEEIEALSAKIEEIEREDVVTEEEIMNYERSLKEMREPEEIENISWKDRYLESRKVKTVLTTSNIFNAMRKKNKELRKKLNEVNRREDTKKDEEIADIVKNLEVTLIEGSVEYYNTLEGSTKYVDPIKEVIECSKHDADAEKAGERAGEGKITREMRRDAKQLLKMYKKLLKYNDMEKKRDPTRKKRKKKDKCKSRDRDVISCQQKNSVD